MHRIHFADIFTADIFQNIHCTSIYQAAMQLLIHLKNVINISVYGWTHFIQCSVLRGAELKFIANNINLKLINGNENVGM